MAIKSKIMKANFESVKSIITDFESNKILLEKALELIFEITKKKLTKYELTNYWRSENIDEYVNRLIASSIIDWKEIDDQRALNLIQEILDNIGDDSILEVNSEALEKRYSKAKGTITDWIFQNDVFNASKILELLKEETTFLL